MLDSYTLNAEFDDEEIFVDTLGIVYDTTKPEHLDTICVQVDSVKDYDHIEELGENVRKIEYTIYNQSESPENGTYGEVYITKNSEDSYERLRVRGEYMECFTEKIYNTKQGDSFKLVELTYTVDNTQIDYYKDFKDTYSLCDADRIKLY